MKFRLFIASCFLLIAVGVSAQRKTMVVKFNGDTLYCDNVSAGGKTIICKTKGQSKVTLLSSEVDYYLEPWKIWIENDGKKAVEHDTTRKCFVPADGKIHTVLIENDSLYLTSITKTIDDMEFNDFYIITKKHVEIMEIKEDKTALDNLSKYFGGNCPVFDKQIIAYKPKFQKKVFPIQEWWDLMYVYSNNCK